MLFNLLDFQLPLPSGVQVFASGTNREGEIRGFARLGIPVGVCVSRLNEDAIATLIKLNQPVMVDSGAFSEVTFTPDGARTTRPIGGGEWERRLSLYLRLASSPGARALFVAPDKVGDQHETLKRLGRYRSELAAIAKTGAKVLLPLQVGEMSHEQFFRAAENIAGVELCPAMPMRKAATSDAELLAFLEKAKPCHIHLLGIGIDNRRARRLIRAMQFVSSATTISMDSNRLRAVAGRGRPLTELEVELRSAPADNLYGEVQSPVLKLNNEILDYTDLIAFPSLWIGEDRLKAIADALHLAHPARSAFIESPDEFLQKPWIESGDLAWIEHPVMSYELDRAWHQFVEERIRSGVRSAAIADVFRNSQISNQIKQAA